MSIALDLLWRSELDVLCRAALDFLLLFTIYYLRFFCLLLVARDPENLTREFHKVDRRARILVDTGRNDYSAAFLLLTQFAPD